jgi:hypothetical protein
MMLEAMSDLSGTMMAARRSLAVVGRLQHRRSWSVNVNEVRLMARRAAPPSWPREVPAPVGREWIPGAVAWLLDHCPPEYRSYGVLRRQPAVLARCTAWHVRAQEQALRQGLAAARRELAGEGAAVVDETLMMLENELTRVQVLGRSVAAVEHALTLR